MGSTTVSSLQGCCHLFTPCARFGFGTLSLAAMVRHGGMERPHLQWLMFVRLVQPLAVPGSGGCGCLWNRRHWPSSSSHSPLHSHPPFPPRLPPCHLLPDPQPSPAAPLSKAWPAGGHRERAEGHQRQRGQRGDRHRGRRGAGRAVHHLPRGAPLGPHGAAGDQRAAGGWFAGEQGVLGERWGRAGSPTRYGLRHVRAVATGCLCDVRYRLSCTPHCRRHQGTSRVIGS